MVQLPYTEGNETNPLSRYFRQRVCLFEVAVLPYGLINNFIEFT